MYKYITGIIQTHNHKLLAINEMPDHLHLFFGMRPIQSLSDLMQDIKGSSSKWINEKKFIIDKFEWSRLWRIGVKLIFILLIQICHINSVGTLVIAAMPGY